MSHAYPPEQDPAMFFLKDFQARRLRTTYDDLAAQPQYKAACFFFFNRLYTTEDTAERDKSFRKIHDIARRWLGGDVTRSMDRLIDLQELTLELDAHLLRTLQVHGAPTAFEASHYEAAYAACDNYPARERQIELLAFTMRLVHRISHRFGIGMVLAGLRAACVVAGDTRMVDFLYDGYHAFRDQRHIEPLAEAMITRETERLNRIYGRPYTTVW